MLNVLDRYNLSERNSIRYPYRKVVTYRCSFR